MTPLLEFEAISKSFFGVPVLKNVSFSVGRGSVLGLVGENGAGKSTLMNVLGGNLRADAGTMRLNGEKYEPENPKAARRAGIAFVHQELNLFPNLSIAENLFLTSMPRHGPLIRRSAMRERASELLRTAGLELSPETMVERLSTGERQLVEIARALSFDARLIILDEPTTSLSSRECEVLFQLIAQLRAEGRSLIYISHVLGDVRRLCDQIVVLRDGEVVADRRGAEFSSEQLVSLMVGRALTQIFPARQKQPSLEPLLEVRDVTQPGIARQISFTLHKGEVLGVAGLMGAGRTELARILFGLDPGRADVQLNGRRLEGPPAERIARGLALVTESRREDGLCMNATIAENITSVTLPRFARGPARLLRFDAMAEAVQGIREAVRLQARVRDDHPVKSLSGGNQQKVVLAKWLLAQPRALVLDEPTRGIDVGAKYEIYTLIHQLADNGAGVLVISSEIEELIGICDRILVMSRGRVTASFARSEFDRERILAAALPHEDKP